MMTTEAPVKCKHNTSPYYFFLLVSSSSRVITFSQVSKLRKRKTVKLLRVHILEGDFLCGQTVMSCMCRGGLSAKKGCTDTHADTGGKRDIRLLASYISFWDERVMMTSWQEEKKRQGRTALLLLKDIMSSLALLHFSCNFVVHTSNTLLFLLAFVSPALECMYALFIKVW